VRPHPVLSALLLLLVTACAPSLFTSRPPLAAQASVADDPAQHSLRFVLAADAPLARAQLIIGSQDGRAPIDVPLNAQPLAYTLHVPDEGLLLPPGESVLRYAWLLRSIDGETLTLAQSTTSPQLLRNDAPPVLQWHETQVNNFSLRYLDDTAAARDIDLVKQTATDALTRSTLALDWSPRKPLVIYLVPRIFWQGGADFDKTIFISYAEREYTGVTLADYIAHEGAHALTSDWGNLGAAGGMLAEGIAVYATGGHYQPDVLDQSAATLVQSPLFIPPSILRRDFANQQHEIAYTESGSFVRYLIDRSGLDKFHALMRRPTDWQAIYGKDFEGLTQDWLATLRQLSVTNADLRRWQLKIRFYNLLRTYEERFDPDARRLPSPDPSKWDVALRQAMRAPADSEDNRVLELMLQMAIRSIENSRSPQQLDLGERYLADVERKVQTPAAPDDDLMADVRAIVKVLEQQEQGLLDRDWRTVEQTLDGASTPQFNAQFIAQTKSQPAWLHFAETPVQLSLSAGEAWLTVAQWAEPLDAHQAVDDNGQRWVMALNKRDGQWLIAGRFPVSPAVLMAR